MPSSNVTTPGSSSPRPTSPGNALSRLPPAASSFEACIFSINCYNDGGPVTPSNSTLQVVAQFAVPAPAAGGAPPEGEPVTMGEALEAEVLTDGEKKVDRADAAAIQAAEVRATGLGGVTPGGVGSEAQAAAASNARGEQEVSLRDVLRDATSKIRRDKVVTPEDSRKVAAAEQRNRGQGASEGGVAASVVAASRLNENRKA
ncbi:late embryogenesis abundant protein 31-like isoform X2 [Phoenix dactylifera]|uniref:Late embryogenesis abundant protein 31-like isoform X2 n=1 Tax=Phoenix dactylifera TaxID=42345 RepID=A0A8B8J7T0_PHODC|nr:late embryogenesis abundant protein 31-like isoform X2 [Phoenix dactylifera]